MPQLRSIKASYDIIKSQDENTAITAHTIRTWCKEGKIKCLTAGSKILVDIDFLKEYVGITNKEQ